MSEKQNLIKAYLSKVEHATIGEILENMPFSYHHNNKKHLGGILSSMVKNGTLKRIKKGVFRMINESDCKKESNTLF